MLSDCPKCDGEGVLVTSPPDLGPDDIRCETCPACKGARIVTFKSPRCEICLEPGATPGKTLQGEKMLCDDCEGAARRQRVAHHQAIEAARAERDFCCGVAS